MFLAIIHSSLKSAKCKRQKNQNITKYSLCWLNQTFCDLTSPFCLAWWFATGLPPLFWASISACIFANISFILRNWKKSREITLVKETFRLPQNKIAKITLTSPTIAVVLCAWNVDTNVAVILGQKPP